MATNLLKEIHSLRQAIHANDAPPDSKAERQTTDAMQEIQTVVMKLLIDGVPPQMLETSLFYHWLRLSVFALGKDDDAFEGLSKDLHGVMGRVVARIKSVADELEDAGPSPEMQQLGSLIGQARRAMFEMMGSQPVLSDAEIKRRANDTSLAIMSFIQAKLDLQLNPGTLVTLLLYHWLRLSTFREQVDEGFFQKLERNWGTVAARVQELARSLLYGGPETERQRNTALH